MQDSYTEDPLVSVIIPTYQRSKAFLSRAVSSVRNQTYRNLEILIVDDSTEAFPLRKQNEDYLRSLKDPRITYLQNEKNCGGALTRNRGIFAASGKYITFLDDDDAYLPRKVEKQVRFMEEGGYDASLTEMAIFSGDGKLIDYREHKDLTDFSTEGLFRYHLRKHLTGTPTYMFRADKLKQIGGFDDAKLSQEFYLMAKAIRSGLKIGYLPECDVTVYLHSGERISTGKNKITGEKRLYQYKKQFFPQLNPDEIRCIRFRYHAVMVVAYQRSRRYLPMLWEGILAFFCAPLIFPKEVGGFVRRILKQRSRMGAVSYEQAGL